MSIVFEKKIGGEKTATRPSGWQSTPNFVNYTFSVKYFCTKNLVYLMSFLYKMHKLSNMHKKGWSKTILYYAYYTYMQNAQKPFEKIVQVLFQYFLLVSHC